MNLTSPALKGVPHVAEVPGSSVASLFKMADDSPDGMLGMLMSGLSGVAAALAVAIVLTIYFRTGYRSSRDVMRHGLAATAVLALLAFVAWDMRHAALAYLGINPAKPSVEFEIRLPKAALAAVADSQVELVTDRNQKLAQMQAALAEQRAHQIVGERRGDVDLRFADQAGEDDPGKEQGKRQHETAHRQLHDRRTESPLAVADCKRVSDQKADEQSDM